MGAKTNTQQLSTQTPLQQALMNQQLQAVMKMLGSGTAGLGGTWGGARPAAGAGLGQGSGSAPTSGSLQGILAQNANGVRDQFTTPFVSPYRRNITGA